MAKFEYDDSAFDDLATSFDNYPVTITCSECGFSFNILLDNLISPVICPHCKSELKIESE